MHFLDFKKSQKSGISWKSCFFVPMLLRDHVFVFSMFGIIVSILKLNSIFSVKKHDFCTIPSNTCWKNTIFSSNFVHFVHLSVRIPCVSRGHHRNEITGQQRTRRETKSHHPRIIFLGSFGTVSIIQSHCLRPLKVKNVILLVLGSWDLVSRLLR